MAAQPQTPPRVSNVSAASAAPAVSPTRIPNADNAASAISPSRTPASTSNVSSSRLSADTVRVIMQSLRCKNMNDAAATVLASDAEYRIREIIQDSVKFMKHSKRDRLIPDDINAALRLRNVAPTYGFGRTAKAESLVQPNGVASSSANASQFRNAEGVPDLYFAVDRVHNLKALAEAPLPPLPLEVTVAPHWLAINGVQPVIPQNPLPLELEVSDESSAAAAPDANKDAACVVNTVDGRNARHVLSKELQLYFDHTVESLAGDDVGRKNAVLTSISEQPGLVQLLPYFVRHVTNSVRIAVDKTQSDKDKVNVLSTLTSSMRLVRALLLNKHFQLEKYLHHLLPVICTCVVGRRLYNKPRDNHWELRDFSARILYDICVKYRDNYETIQTRISKTLLEAVLDPKKSLTTHYGAIVGLATLGKHVVDATFLPRLGMYIKRVREVFDDPKLKIRHKSIRRLEACKVIGAICFALCTSAGLKQSLDISSSSAYKFTPDLFKVTTEQFQDLPIDFRDFVAEAEKVSGASIYPHQTDLRSFEGDAN